MKYYRLFRSIDPKVNGRDPQISELITSTSMLSPNFAGNLSYNRATSATDIPKGILHSKAKLTDLLTADIMGVEYYISGRLKRILESGECDGVEFLPTNIIAKDKELDDYWVLNPYQTNYPFLDVEQTAFAHMDFMQDIVRREVAFKTVEEFFKAWEENKKKDQALGTQFDKCEPLYIRTIAIRHNSNIDFFSLRPIRPGWNGYFVSENMKEKIEAAECTGMVFRELNGPLFD